MIRTHELKGRSTIVLLMPYWSVLRAPYQLRPSEVLRNPSLGDEQNDNNTQKQQHVRQNSTARKRH